PPYTRLHPFSMQRPPPPSTLFPYTTVFVVPVLRGPSTFFLHVVPPRRSSTFLMLDPIRRLLTEAGKAKQTRAFWQTVTEILSEYAGGARVELIYKGLSESGTLDAGAA